MKEIENVFNLCPFEFIKVEEVGINVEEYTLEVYVLPANTENKKLLELAQNIRIEKLPSFNIDRSKRQEYSNPNKY
jgi:hypothetical protein